MNISFTTVCYSSKQTKLNQNPLMLRICMGGKKKYRTLDISINPEHWDFKKNQPKRNCPNKEFVGRTKTPISQDDKFLSSFSQVLQYD